MPGEDTHAVRFGLFFSRYDRELRRFVRKFLADKRDVDDCVQETFLSLWKQETNGALREDPRSYLFVTARNVIRDLGRKMRSRHLDQHVPLSEDIEGIRSIDGERTLMHREGLRLIEAQLSALRPSTRVVFLLHYVELLAFDEIAKRLGISTRTVERELARALEHCRTSLAGASKDILGE